MKMLMITVKNIPQKNSHFDFPFGIIELVPVKLVFKLFSAPMLFIISFLLTCAFSFSMKSAFFLNLLKIHCSISPSISINVELHMGNRDSFRKRSYFLWFITMQLYKIFFFYFLLTILLYTLRIFWTYHLRNCNLG